MGPDGDDGVSHPSSHDLCTLLPFEARGLRPWISLSSWTVAGRCCAGVSAAARDIPIEVKWRAAPAARHRADSETCITFRRSRPLEYRVVHERSRQNFRRLRGTSPEFPQPVQRT